MVVEQAATSQQYGHRAWEPAMHGGLLVGLLLVPIFVKTLASWPLYLLAPLLAYGLIVCCLGPLRRTVSWLRMGRHDGPVILVTLAVIVLSSSVLLVYSVLFPVESPELVAPILGWLPSELLLAGVLFAVLNGLLEEIIFRGILLDALRAEVGLPVALLVQSVGFGVGHAHGYPPGAIGIILASIYGMVLGLLRLYARGMVAPIVAHIAADATIFAIVMKQFP